MTDSSGPPRGACRRAPGRALAFRRFPPLVAALVLVLVTACGTGDPGGKKTLVVYAAASLKGTFTELEAQFESTHEGVDVQMSFGGSSDLATQIVGEAPADVFASADTATMDTLGDRAIDPEDFATNTLQIVVPPGNPAGITTFDDLTDADVKLVVCAPEVPCGSATQKVAASAGVELQPDSQEQSVTDVLGKIVSGEADAGLVYVTDVAAAGDTVEGIDVPEAADVVNTYPIALVEGSEQEELAREFIGLVLSDVGQRVLRDTGFGPP